MKEITFISFVIGIIAKCMKDEFALPDDCFSYEITEQDVISNRDNYKCCDK